MATTDIIFDVKTVDTQLAEKYVHTKSELNSYGFTGNESHEYDKFMNKICITNIDAEPINVDGTASHSDTLDKLFALAKLIEKNADLFCQLEYLIRGIPVDDVKKCDLKLITDNLLYCYKVKKTNEVYNNVYCDKIAFLADTPLAALGFIAQSLCCGCVNKKNSITIISNKDTAIICSLFVDLCREVGFEEVFLQLVSKDADCSKYNILEIEEMSTGCVGIVTSKSDVDSAVDAFVSSTVWVRSRFSMIIIFESVDDVKRSLQYPWRVKKIFVQESVLERFKRALAWKAEKRAPPCGEDDVEVSCAASYRCGDKVFALEATGECGARVVALEAYRTVRELLVLLGALRPLAASLWSSDVAESLEIAHGLSSSVVWVNDFADFRGPPRASQAFYSVVDVHLSTQTVDCGPTFDTLETLRMSWLRLGEEEREESLTRRDEKNTAITKIDVENDVQDSFVRVIGNGVVTGTIAPAGIWQSDFLSTSTYTIKNFLLKGGGLSVRDIVLSCHPFLSVFSQIKGIPIVYEECLNKQSCRSAKVLWKPSYEHKVIWTNYGTMFAN